MKFICLLMIFFSAGGAHAAQFEFKNYPGELAGSCYASGSGGKSLSNGYLTLRQQGSRLFYRLEVGSSTSGISELIDVDIKKKTASGVYVSTAKVTIDSAGFVTKIAEQYFENTCDQRFGERIVFSGNGKAANIEIFRSVGRFLSRDKAGRETCRYYSDTIKCYFDGTLRNVALPFPTQ